MTYPSADTPMPNYLPLLFGTADGTTFPPGTLSVATVAHDDGCGIWAGGVCDCDPDIRIIRCDPPAAGTKRRPE